MSDTTGPHEDSAALVEQTSVMAASQWCLVGNVVDERVGGEDGTERHHGTKHFSPGTKVYCLAPRWGDGYEKILVVGRHRAVGAGPWISLVMPSKWITNWRAQVVHHPAVLRRLHEATQETWQDNWNSREQVEGWAEHLNDREAKRDS